MLIFALHVRTSTSCRAESSKSLRNYSQNFALLRRYATNKKDNYKCYRLLVTCSCKNSVSEPKQKHELFITNFGVTFSKSEFLRLLTKDLVFFCSSPFSFHDDFCCILEFNLSKPGRILFLFCIPFPAMQPFHPLAALTASHPKGGIRGQP